MVQVQFADLDVRVDERNVVARRIIYWLRGAAQELNTSRALQNTKSFKKCFAAIVLRCLRATASITDLVKASVRVRYLEEI